MLKYRILASSKENVKVMQANKRGYAIAWYEYIMYIYSNMFMMGSKLTQK